ncbi:hypothetical protein ACVWXM_009695 [Bradyrhizobium sp. GM7.3]
MIREAQVNFAIRWFAGIARMSCYRTIQDDRRDRQRCGEERFRRTFERTFEACLRADIATVEVVHVDASLIRADVSGESLTEQPMVDVLNENQSEMKARERAGRATT